MFERFGQIFVGFSQDKNTVTAMVDRKDMTMSGSITTEKGEVRPFNAKKI